VTKPFEQWTVLPHGKLSQVEDNLLTVTGNLKMPLTELPRRMTIVRLNDARLVVYSAIALDDDEMAALERYGRPTFLIVPSALHRLDAKIWKDRYPWMQVVAPTGARAKIQESVQVDTDRPRFEDPNVVFATIAGSQDREAALLVRTPSGTTLVLNDVVGNIHDERGLGGWLLRLAGFAGDEAQIPRVVKMRLVEDEKALRAQLLEWSENPTLNRILVSHGAPIEDDPRSVLRKLAGSLD
jgi:hypothetical protein